MRLNSIITGLIGGAIALALMLAASAAPGMNAESSNAAWRTYTNARYGTVVSYPDDIFRMGEPPGDNAGRSFAGPDGSRFFVYSSANALEQSLAALRDEETAGLARADVIASSMRADGFTLVLRKKGEIVHRHLVTTEDNGFLHWLEIGYPEAQRARFAPIAERMIRSFHVDADVTRQHRTQGDDTTRTAQARPPAARSTDAGEITLLLERDWYFRPPSKRYADLPALSAEVAYLPDNTMGRLTFVCQKAKPSPAYFALLVAPGFPAQDDVAVRIGAAGAGRQGTLELVMRNLYGTHGGERPQIDWDATILFAPVNMEDLAALARADALIVAAAGMRWRLPTSGLAQASEIFLRHCEARR